MFEKHIFFLLLISNREI